MSSGEPDHTAVHTAPWRALHVELDPRRTCWPISSACNWVARARFVEDLVDGQGVGQYVILGAGLDTFRAAPP